MLNYLSVKNVTVIESAALELGDGLNVITGETGAGKSVLVGALKFLMGDRFNRGVIRDPNLKMTVEGIFQGVDKKIPAELKENFEIDDELSLSRQSDDAGKNRVLINGQAAPVTKLKDLSEYLIDIHGQHEHQLLFDSDKHLGIIDFFVNDMLKKNYGADYEIYRKKENELTELKNNASETSKLREMYEFQLDEINLMNIDFAKDSKLNETIEFLSNIEKIREATALCMDILKDGEINAVSLLGKAEKAVDSVMKSAPELSNAAENLRGASSLIEDAVANIESVFEKQEVNPDDLNNLIDRKFKLSTLIKKYGQDLQTVLFYKEKIENDLNNFANYDGVLATLEKETSFLKVKAQKSADVLNEARSLAAIEISKKVTEILKELELPQSKFEARFTSSSILDAKGGVAAEFFISTNPGFQPGPLASVASGGEISRVMLALKEVFGDADGVSTMLFDEIDTGISGKAAKSVAEKLKKLSKNKQIIVITHLPVVAAMGHTHFHITKDGDSGLSKTKIDKLTEEERPNIIATMIAGSATAASIAQAKELLKEADEQTI